MKKLVLIGLLGAFAVSTSGCALLAVGAGGAYVYNEHDKNKKRRGN